VASGAGKKTSLRRGGKERTKPTNGSGNRKSTLERQSGTHSGHGRLWEKEGGTGPKKADIPRFSCRATKICGEKQKRVRRRSLYCTDDGTEAGASGLIEPQMGVRGGEDSTSFGGDESMLSFRSVSLERGEKTSGSANGQIQYFRGGEKKRKERGPTS